MHLDLSAQPIADIEIEARKPSVGAALDPVRVRWPQHEADEVEAAASVLRSGRVNSFVHGDQCRAFEAEFAEYCGAPLAISVANGTVALELALKALGVGPGDEVIVPARSFFASTSCVVAVGATPVFADVDPVSQTIDVASAQALVNARTRAVICVHLAGWPCDMTGLQRLVEEHKIWLIEDCAQAHGAAIDGKRVGSFGHTAAFSFCTDKIMSTGGEGGMLLLQDEGHWARAWAYKDHGKDPAKALNPVAGGAFRYLHDSFGTNFRMTEFQAAIGRVQLRKLPSWLKQRRANAQTLLRLLGDQPMIDTPQVPANVDHAFYKFYVLLNLDEMRSDRSMAELIMALNAAGVPASSGSCPDMSREKACRDRNFGNPAACHVAAEIGRRSLMLPVDHLLTEDDMERMAKIIKRILVDFEKAPGVADNVG
jgi:dTDP-4-amino-4,6-dideoxygalactose transaminase